MLMHKTYGNIYADAGCTKEALGNILPEIGAEKILLIHDSKIDISSLFFMDFAGIMPVDCSKEPTYDLLDIYIKNLRILHSRVKYDCIIGIGGGSAIDIAKAMAVLLTNKETPIQLRGFDKVKNKGIPTILIPTSLSGADATNSASFIDIKEKRKMGINGRYMFADYVILDSDWMVPIDSLSFAGTLLDACCHAYGSSICKQSNALTKDNSNGALQTFLNYLENDKSESITSLQIAAWKAGRSLCNSGSGIAGVLSYMLGVHYNIPHGIACGIFLPSVMRFNDNNISRAYEGTRPDVVIDSFLKKRSISVFLQDYGVKSIEEFYDLIRPLQAGFDQNPKQFDAEKDGLELLKKHWRE